MTIDNQTAYRTDHLRAIFQKAAEIELDPEKRKVIVVRVIYTRGGASSGHAYLGGRHATVRVRHPESRSWKARIQREPGYLQMSVASVAQHEFAHLRGQTHQRMPKYLKWGDGWKEHFQWAKDLPLDVKPTKAAVKATADDKLAHVQKMLKAAQTRVKRATTLLKKWQAREKYYLRSQERTAAMTTEPVAPAPVEGVTT